MKWEIVARHWRAWQTPILVSLGLATLYLGLFLIFPGFSVIDDGWTLHVTHGLQNSPLSEWPSYLAEPAIGRLRPVYYLYFYVLYLVGGARPFLFWFGQWAVLAATLFVMYRVILQATNNSKVALVGLVVPFLFPALPENLYRLGTQEPRQFLFELLFLWWAMQLNEKNLTVFRSLIGILLLVLALGSKETSLVLLPLFASIYGLQLILGRWRSPAFLALTIVVGLVGVGFYALIPTAASYSRGYQLSFDTILLTAHQVKLTEIHVFWLLGVAGCLTAVRLYFFTTTNKLQKVLQANLWQLIFLLATVLSLLIILPWNLQLERYYYNVTLFVTLFVVAECAAWYSLHKKILKLKFGQKVLVCGVALVLIAGMTKIVFKQQLPRYPSMFQNTVHSMKIWFSSYQNNHAAIEYLMAEMPDGGTLYVAHGDYEVVYDMSEYASLFGERPIRVLSENQQLVDDRGLPFEFVADPYLAYEADTGPKLLIDKADYPKLAEVSTPVEVLKPRFSFHTQLKNFWGATKSE